LSQVGDNGQEENIDSDGGSVDLLKSTEDPVGDDLTSVKNCHRQSLAGSLRRDLKVGRQEVGSGISTLSFGSSALSSNERWQLEL
jgi:hypothetical protein